MVPVADCQTLCFAAAVNSSFPGCLLADAVNYLADYTQAPIAICGQSILAAVALAVQGHADIDIDGRSSPISEFFLTIGESGERKSAA